MESKENTPMTREQIFAAKADNYSVCYTATCPLYVRQVIKNAGWTEEPRFLGYVEEYLW